MSILEGLNDRLESDAPAVWNALSPLGRRAYYPPDIPFQAAQARDKKFNATIGQITDGAGRLLAPAAIESTLALEEPLRNRALLYSPIPGFPDLRREWARRQCPSDVDPDSVSLPVVTAGLTHGLSICADLFGGEGRRVVVPAPFWGNYRQIFGVRTGAEIVAAEAYPGGSFAPRAILDTIGDCPAGEPVMVILNTPSNPVGYTPTAAERDALLAGLLEAASTRSLVVLCDDAYAGLVYGDVPSRSPFWDLAGRHPNLLAVRIAGATKELSLFGGRVGFVTFGVSGDGDAAQVLENKCCGLLRSTIGSPVAVSQTIVLKALQDPSLDDQVAAIIDTLRERYETLQEALRQLEERLEGAVVPLPCNSGVFSLLRLPDVLDAEAVRRRLLDHHDTGVISVQSRYLRIAFCSTSLESIAPLVRSIGDGIESALEDAG